MTRLAPDSNSALSVAVRRHETVVALGRALSEIGAPAEGDLVVGVSGGPDSVALLVGLVALASRRSSPPRRLTAVHVHHHLRGADADADAALVAELTARLRVELRTIHLDPTTMTGNLAEACRTGRYAALAEIAGEVGASAVAVAHHADDQFELLLMNLARGAGVDGMTGMPRSRPLTDDVALIRPLLDVRKCDCEDLCRAAGIEPRVDTSNADPKNRRGRLRRDVMPVFEEMWPDAARRAAGAASAVRAAADSHALHLTRTFGSASTTSWPRHALAALSTEDRAAGLRRALQAEAPASADAVGRRHLLEAARAISLPGSRSFQWANGVALEITKDTVRLRPGA